MSTNRVVAFCVLLSLAAQAEAAPAGESQCIGRQKDEGRFVYTLPYYVSEVMRDSSCTAFWNINNRVVASADGFVNPVLSTTLDTITADTCPDQLTFRLSCPSSNIDEDLTCSCESGSPHQKVNSDAHKHTVPYEWLGTVITMRLLTL